MPNDTAPQERFEVLQLNARIDQLQQALLTKDPMMGEHLKHIHKLMLEFDDTPHLLRDDQRATYIAGLKQYRQVEMVKQVVAKKTGGRRKFTEDDI